MRTSIALIGVAVVGMVLAGCAAQQASTRLGPAVETQAPSSKTTVTIEPTPQSRAYPAGPMVSVADCDVSHPLYRKAKTLLVGPARRAHLSVQLKARCPSLQDLATVNVIRCASKCRYFIGDQPLDRRANIVLRPGTHTIYALVVGEMVPVAEVILEPDTDYFACLSEM